MFAFDLLKGIGGTENKSGGCSLHNRFDPREIDATNREILGSLVFGTLWNEFSKLSNPMLPGFGEQGYEIILFELFFNGVNSFLKSFYSSLLNGKLYKFLIMSW